MTGLPPVICAFPWGKYADFQISIQRRKYHETNQHQKLERLAEKYKRKVDREQAARKAEFEAVMQYSSEKDILDAYGWEFITEKQYDRYLELFREGQNALEHHAPTCSEIAYGILCRMAASVQRDIQEWEFCALTPEQQRTARERAEKNQIEWKRKIAEIKKRRGIIEDDSHPPIADTNQACTTLVLRL